MKLEVLGTGCPKCKQLMSMVQQAVRECGVEAELVKVEKINDIINYGVMVTPALVVNGKVVATGRVPGIAEIKAWIGEIRK